MMTTPTTAVPRPAQAAPGVGCTSAFDQIEGPGAYVCAWSGHLLRIPEDAVTPGRSPVLEILGKDDPHVTKISENPFVPLTKARMVASDLDLDVNF